MRWLKRIRRFLFGKPPFYTEHFEPVRKKNRSSPDRFVSFPRFTLLPASELVLGITAALKTIT